MPAALAISAFAPWAVTPLLMVGGAFLCFEGFEKLAHRFLHGRADDDAQHAELTQALADPDVDLVALERDKIKGAVRTDFILSAEIIAIIARHRGRRAVRDPGRGAGRHRGDHDGGRLRPGGRHRQARRRRASG